MLKAMRNYGFGAVAATALSVLPISAFSQSIEVGPGGVRVYDGRGGGQCEQLRRACENKDALGERGEEIAADTVRPAKGQFGGMCAPN